MPPEVSLALLAVAILANLGVMVAILLFALYGRGPLRRFVRDDRPGAGHGDAAGAGATAEPPPPAPPHAHVRLLERQRRPVPDPRADRQADGGRRRRGVAELDEVLGSSAMGPTYNRTVRILAWTFILMCFVIVAATGLWKPVQPQIVVVLALGGIAVLVVHELMPPAGLGSFRFVIEGTAAIAFLTLLVMLTGKAMSPFFFVYPLLVGAAALVAAPGITLLLTVEAAAAYLLAAASEPLGDPEVVRQVFAYVGINLTALTLLAYAGMVISREQRRTRDAAIRLSTVDSLTNLYNRAYFFSALEREIQRSRRFRRDFCLLMMDLDGLKAVNDRFGHYHGDLVLRGIARVIDGALREVDVAARYGGDEFVALLPETDPSGAYVVAEKIRQGATELLVEAAGQHISTSLSIGVVSYPEDGQTADELMIGADEAMYSSKRLGKNRVVGFTEPGTAAGQPAATAPAPVPAPPRRAPVATPGFRPLSGKDSDASEPPARPDQPPRVDPPARPDQPRRPE